MRTIGVGDRGRTASRRDCRHHPQRLGVDDRDRAGLVVRDEGMPAVVAQCQIMSTRRGADPGRQRALVDLQDGDARVGMAGRTAGDPEVPAIRLYGQAVGADSGRHVRRHLPGLGIDDGHLIRVGHGDEDLAAARPQGPIVSTRRQRHKGQELGPAEAEERVDHGDRRVVVQRHRIVDVEVKLGAVEQAPVDERCARRRASRGVVGRASGRRGTAQAEGYTLARGKPPAVSVIANATRTS